MRILIDTLGERKLQVILLCIVSLAVVGSVLIYWLSMRFDKDQFESVINSANQSFEQSNYSESLSQYLEAIEIAPRQVDGYLGVVKVLGTKARFDEADKVVNEGKIYLDQNSISNLYSELGNYFKSAGYYSEALERYELAYKSEQSDLLASYILEASILSGDLDKASSIRTKISNPDGLEIVRVWDSYEEIRKNDEDLTSRAIASREYINSGYPSLSLSLLEEVRADMASYWEGIYFLGRSKFDLGEFDGAILDFEEAVLLGSDDPHLYLYLARSNVLALEKNVAYRYYDRAIEFAKGADSEQIAIEYFDLLLSDGQYLQAERVLSKFRNANWTQVLYMSLYSQQKKWPEFLQSSTQYNITRTLESRASIQRYYELLFDYYIMNDDASSLEQNLNDYGVTSLPNDSYLLYSGRLARMLDERTKAKELFERAIDADLNGNVTREALRELNNIR